MTIEDRLAKLEKDLAQTRVDSLAAMGGAAKAVLVAQELACRALEIAGEANPSGLEAQIRAVRLELQQRRQAGESVDGAQRLLDALYRAERSRQKSQGLGPINCH